MKHPLLEMPPLFTQFALPRFDLLSRSGGPVFKRGLIIVDATPPPREWYRPVNLHDPIWREVLPRWIRVGAVDAHVGRLLENVRR